MVRIAPYYFSQRKRVFDILVSIFLLLLLTPFIVIISLVIFVTVGSPILFLQQRRGYHKEPFQIFKFRTMYHNAEKDRNKLKKHNDAPEPMFKMNRDPRFVGIGHFLSTTGIDETPQLLNILKGEMSFVGPRPLPMIEALKLTAEWDFRYQVRPGIFSLWAFSDDKYTSLDTWKQLEERSLRDSSFSKDCYLMAKTLLTHFIYFLVLLKNSVLKNHSTASDRE
ncbi:MAG: sugar transferase [bacterium]|nr:sugar transferase [bacterium]